MKTIWCNSYLIGIQSILEDPGHVLQYYIKGQCLIILTKKKYNGERTRKLYANIFPFLQQENNRFKLGQEFCVGENCELEKKQRLYLSIIEQQI